MSSNDHYVVHYTAIIRGRAYYSCPEGEKIKSFIDGFSDVEWDVGSIERVEQGDVEFLYTDPAGEPVEVGESDEFPF